jgi:hypothetical protein
VTGFLAKKTPGLTTQIFIGLFAGILVGYLWPDVGQRIKPIADAFLRMIRMIIAPLIFSTLVVGIAGTGDMKAMGRIGLKALVYFEIATTIALVLGLVLVNVFKPGVGLVMPVGADTAAISAMSQGQQHGWDIFLHLFPTSVVDAMARGDILQLVVFSTFFGVALAAVGPKGRPVLDVLTPHPGEAARLLGMTVAEVEADRLAAARALATAAHAVVVLKGARTVVCDGTLGDDFCSINPTGGPELATAGTGDVLAGVIGALLAQGMAAAAAARTAVYVHGLAGRQLAADLGSRGVVSSDLPRVIAGVLATISRPA